MVDSCGRTLLPYLFPELYSFTLVQATIDACGWNLHELPSLASLQACRKVIIIKKNVMKWKYRTVHKYLDKYIIIIGKF